MRMLLTSAGIRNDNIRNELLRLLGKPIADCVALGNSTSSYALPNGTKLAWNFVTGNEPRTPMLELGWKSIGILELSALPSVPQDRWRPALEAADVLLVNGGDPLYLAYWMRTSGVAAILPTLNLVYVGLSAGSMILTPDIGAEFVGWTSDAGADAPLGLVDFSIFPHLNTPDLPKNTLATARMWAEKLTNPAYAIDDETAISVVDGEITVVSGGTWEQLR